MCETCGKTFGCADKLIITRHVEKCAGVSYMCEHVDDKSKKCEYKTKVKLDFKRHQKIHQGLGHCCDVCGKLYPTKQQLKQHVVIHQTTRENFVCQECGQKFLRKDALQRHNIRNHWQPQSEAELHKCTYCSYTAKLKHDLTTHLHTHVKKLSCSLCEFTTNLKSSLTNHMVYHESDRKFPCNQEKCFYSALSSSQLSSHVNRVHRAAYKHQCPICKNMYKVRTHLARHIVTHSAGLSYCCLECGQGFKSHTSYYKHRNLTGHDSKREGVVSLPQNITITYMSADKNNQHNCDVNHMPSVEEGHEKQNCSDLEQGQGRV